MSDTKPNAFVIMPFSGEFDAVFKGLIAPALDAFNVVRADTQLDQRSILEKIVTGIAEADLIVTDITAVNANVMYELGIAHTLGKPVVMITQNLDELPFDVSAYPVHEYSTHFQRANDLLSKLRELSTRHRQGLVRFASPVTDFLPTTLMPRSKASSLSDTADDPEQDEEPAAPGVAPLDETAPRAYGYIDFAADLEEHGGGAQEQMQRLNELTGRLTVRMQELTPKIKAARNSSAPGSASLARRLTNELADEFKAYARAIGGEVIPRFHDSWERVGQSLLWLLQQKNVDTATEEDVRMLLENTSELHTVLISNIDSMAQVRPLFGMMRRQTGELTRAADEAERALTRLMGEYTLATSYLSKIQEHVETGHSTSQ